MTPSLARTINLLGVFGICSVLLGAYFIQFVLGEFPCPLCLLQRMGMLGVAFGFLLNLRYGISTTNYSVSIISAMVGASVSVRQIFLHIVPEAGEPTGYGSAVMGLHLYSWAFLVFASTILVIAILMLFTKQFEKPDEEITLNKVEKFAFGLVMFIAVANVITTFLMCGIAPCPDNPDRYLML